MIAHIHKLAETKHAGAHLTLLSETYNENWNWWESVHAMEIPGVGCLVRTRTLRGGGDPINMSESSVLVPGVKIVQDAVGVNRLQPL